MPVCCDCAPGEGAASLACRAVHFLWCAYHDWAGHSGAVLCAHFGMPIIRSPKRSLFWARLMLEKDSKTGTAIFLPEAIPDDASAREEYLIYHELAHHVLIGNMGEVRSSGTWQLAKLHEAEEVWCDNFALAMLLAGCGWKPFGVIRKGHAFLRYGEKFKRKRRDILLAGRLRRAIRKPRKTGSPPKTPLYLLANELLAHADSTQE